MTARERRETNSPPRQASTLTPGPSPCKGEGRASPEALRSDQEGEEDGSVDVWFPFPFEGEGLGMRVKLAVSLPSPCSWGEGLGVRGLTPNASPKTSATAHFAPQRRRMKAGAARTSRAVRTRRKSALPAVIGVPGRSRKPESSDGNSAPARKPNRA